MDLPPKAAEFFVVSNNLDRHGSGGSYLYGSNVLVQWKQPMYVGTGKQHPLERTRHQELRQHALMEV